MKPGLGKRLQPGGDPDRRRGALPAYGIELRPEWSALLMSVSSIIVATNAVLLRRVEQELT